MSNINSHNERRSMWPLFTAAFVAAVVTVIVFVGDGGFTGDVPVYNSSHE